MLPLISEGFPAAANDAPPDRPPPGQYVIRDFPRKTA